MEIGIRNLVWTEPGRADSQIDRPPYIAKQFVFVPCFCLLSFLWEVSKTFALNTLLACAGPQLRTPEEEQEGDSVRRL